MEAAARAAQAPADAANRGRPQTVTPRCRRASDAVAAGAAHSITAVGDSVMLASAPELQAEFPGITIDAAVSRGMGAAPEILRATSTRDRCARYVVVVGLGTNGAVDAADLAAIMRGDRPEPAS